MIALVAPILMAVLYTLSLVSLVFFPPPSDDPPPEMDFNSLQGVVTLFKDPNGVFIGWVHYVCYDVLVGRWITMDSVKLGASYTFHFLVIVPTLFLALMFGPTGYLLYVAVVRTILVSTASNTPSEPTTPTSKAKVW